MDLGIDISLLTNNTLVLRQLPRPLKQVKTQKVLSDVIQYCEKNWEAVWSIQQINDIIHIMLDAIELDTISHVISYVEQKQILKRFYQLPQEKQKAIAHSITRNDIIHHE